MSCGGGSFNYAYWKVHIFVEQLNEELHKADCEFNDETRAQLKFILDDAEKIVFKMKEAELLCSGDIGETTFLERLAEYNRKGS